MFFLNSKQASKQKPLPPWEKRLGKIQTSKTDKQHRPSLDTTFAIIINATKMNINWRWVFDHSYLQPQLSAHPNHINLGSLLPSHCQAKVNPRHRVGDLNWVDLLSCPLVFFLKKVVLPELILLNESNFDGRQFAVVLHKFY